MMLDKKTAIKLNWSGLWQQSDLKGRILFTIFVLVVYRLGTYIPLPGVDPLAMGAMVRDHAGGILGILDMFSGGALSRMTIMTLNLMPYISASIIVQLMTAVVPHFETLKKDGEMGKKRLNQYTRYGTVALATMQALAVAIGIEKVTSSVGPVVIEPGFLFRLSSVVTMVGATLVLMWLGERITARGVGNGSSMIIFTGIVANLPQSAWRAFELGRTGALPVLAVLGVLLGLAALIAFIVFIEKAARKIQVQYPRHHQGRSMIPQQHTSYLPIKLNTAGVIPPIFASALLTLPMTLSSFATSGGVLGFLSQYLRHGHPVFIALYVSFMIFFAFFYTAIVFNADETAENLKNNGGFISGYRPGKATSLFFDDMLSKLTLWGALYISFVCVIPEIIMTYVSLPFYLGGTSVLIVVGVTIETASQVQSYLIAHQYGKFLKPQKGRRLR